MSTSRPTTLSTGLPSSSRLTTRSCQPVSRLTTDSVDRHCGANTYHASSEYAVASDQPCAITGDSASAEAHAARALELAETDPERQFLARQLEDLA